MLKDARNDRVVEASGGELQLVVRHPDNTQGPTIARERRFRGLAEMTQTDLATATGVAQPEISAMEQRSDILLSTLRKVVKATGSELQLVVRYPDSGAVDAVVDA